MIKLQGFSLTLLLIFLALAIIILLGFRLFRSIVLPLIKSKKRQQGWLQALFRIELVSWFLFGVFIMYELLLQAPLVTLIMVLLFFGVTLWWWQDFLPGLLFRYDHDAAVGDQLRFDNQQCTIEAIRLRSLQLKGENGELIIVPYRLLREVVITKAAQQTPLVPFTFQVRYKGAQGIHQIERLMRECPWSVPAHPPKVEEIGEGLYQITSTAPNDEIQAKQQRYLMEQLG